MLRSFLPLLLFATSLPAQQAVVFEHVNVVPMDRERVLRDQTVITRAGRVAFIGPASSAPKVPNALRVEGRGRYLIPGLADMHTHPYDTDGFPSYLRWGVTTIAVMHGTPPVLEWKRRVLNGELAGPTVYTAGPSINGYPPGNPLFVSVETEAQARGAVRQQKLEGYDFIKVYSMLNAREYRAIIDEAKRQHMPVFGHIPFAVGFDSVLTSGQANVAHVEEFFNNGIQDSMFERVARAAAQTGITVTANLFAYAHYLETLADIKQVLNDPEMKFHSPAGLSEKMPETNRALRSDPQGFAKWLRSQQPRMRRLTRLLHDAGVPVFPGTDTETFGYPGDSNLKELDELILAGFSPYQALAAATRAPGRFIAQRLGSSERFGTVAAGSRADLVLLEANPLESLRNLRGVAGTMARGRWYPIAQLEALRDSIARRNRIVHPLIGRLDTLAMLRDSGAAALRLFQDIRRDFPDVTPVGELVLGIYGRQIYLKGDHANATRLREQAAALYARSFAAENEIGRALMYNGDTAAALGHFKKALAHSPYNQIIARTVDRLEDITRPVRFNPIGRFEIDEFVWKVGERQRPVRMALTVSDSAGQRIADLQVDTTTLRVEDLAIGGDHIWIATSYGNAEINLKLSVADDSVSGLWNYGWANNGVLRGRRRSAR